MARGFLSGAIWGGVVGLGMATVASIIAPPPQPPQVTAAAPGVAEVPEAPVSSDTDGAAISEPTPATETSAPAAAPDPDTLAALSEDAQTPGAVPQTGAADDLAAPLAPADQGTVPLEADEPVLPNPQALAPMEPQPADELSISTEPAQPPAPPPSDGETAFDSDDQTASQAPAEETAETPETRPAEEVESAPPVVAELQPLAPTAPKVDEQSAFDSPSQDAVTAQPEAPAITPSAPATDAPVTAVDEQTPAPPQPQPSETETAEEAPEAPPAEAEEEEAPQVALLTPPSTRPQIGTPAVSLTERETGVTINRPVTTAETETAPDPEQTAEADAAADADPRPVMRFAQPFENPEGKPLMSIVLIDDGSSPTSGRAGIAALKSFPNAISFAVDASLPDAAERMTLYREEGFEVLAMVDLPPAAQASDAETSLNAILAQMNQVVGVLEGVQTGLQENRAAADQVTAILASTGHGLLTQNRGLNTMPKLARKEGVPAAPIFRDFDSKGQSAAVIRRFLDQAAFKAGQEGAVVMLGRLRPDTISALLLWGLQDRAGQVAIAPVTAVLTREDS